MKRLLIMRHAKSDWDSEAQTDFERPLNYRGRKDAPKMAQHLIKTNLIPDIVILSSSQRTTETWNRMNAVFTNQNIDIKALSSFEFYHGGLGEIQTMITNLSTEDLQKETIMVLGHNPGWNHAISWLSHADLRLTTANIVVLKHDSDSWTQAIQDTQWKFLFHFQPKTIS